MKFDKQDFSEHRYRQLLELSISQQYKPIFFGEEENEEKFILWRHDVDLDLSASVKIARIEAEEGIRSTFFLMTRSCFYNLFTEDGERIVLELQSLGHQIGIHCDLNLPRDSSVSESFVEKKVNQDFQLVETVFGVGVFKRVVSFHNPPLAVLKKTFSSFYSTYSEKFFGEIKYLSDSNRIWREAPPEEWMVEQRLKKFSILLHPIIWVLAGRTMPEAMKSFCEARNRELKIKLEEDDIVVK